MVFLNVFLFLQLAGGPPKSLDFQNLSLLVKHVTMVMPKDQFSNVCTYHIHFSLPHYFSKLLLWGAFQIHNHPFSFYFTLIYLIFYS